MQRGFDARFTYKTIERCIFVQAGGELPPVFCFAFLLLMMQDCALL
jgi:hypothetical protein